MYNRFEHSHGPFGHNHGPRKCWRFIFGLPIFLAILSLVGFILMSLWNSIIPEIFGIKTISYFQSIGLILISKILLGGFHGCHSAHTFGHRPWDRRKKECETDAGTINRDIKID